MVAATAPGKLILFGEHAVVFGEPAVSVAIDLRTEVFARPFDRWKVDGSDLGNRRYVYVKEALARVWEGGPLWLEIRSAIPIGSGLGSSAAVSVAVLSALLKMRGGFDVEKIAREAFEVEHTVQGRASPIDTTTSANGGGILVLTEQGRNFLWAIEKGQRRWFLHSWKAPKLTFVIGYTGINAPTGPLVERVRRFAESDSRGMNAVREIGKISLEGLEALKVDDLVKAGELMTRNHQLLNFLGVGHPALDRLIEAARSSSLGAKLTGAGGGGSMISLTERIEDTISAIQRAGGKAYAVTVDQRGTEVQG